MAKAGRGKVWLWRWRRSPLRRRSDVVEAWIMLVTWTLALLGGVLAGQSTAEAVDESIAVRRASMHAVPAVLTENAADTASPKASAHKSAYKADTVWANVRWTAPDGSGRTGLTKVEPDSTAGTSVTVWADNRSGDLVPGPPTASEARVEAAVAAALFGTSTTALVLVCGGLVRGRLEQRRLAEWDAEWQRIGPRWTKRMTG